MKENIKKNYLNIIIAIGYITIADLVYGIWTYDSWHLWWATFLIVLAITAVGVVIGFFWIRSEIENSKKQTETSTEK